MAKLSSIEALGESANVHLLEIELGNHVLGGAREGDPFDGERSREAGNLLRRVCTGQSIPGDYAIKAIREGAIRVRCGFVDVADCNIVAKLADAKPVKPLSWGSRWHLVLDTAKEEALNAAGTNRDNRSAGRLAREKFVALERERGLLWRT